AGMNEMQALIAATRTSAELCGVSDQLGTVEAGKLADLIVVRKNPLEAIGSLRKLKLVLRDGKLIEIEEPEGSANFWRLLLS
ncbi:MAG: amidohydrolase family protein, partial [Anaerolineales bacterium]|nr:amidohydrolase family protein [Anaerolineales bacterium]